MGFNDCGPVDLAKVRKDAIDRAIRQVSPGDKNYKRFCEAIELTPSTWVKRYCDALSGEGGLADAVRAKCSECCGFEDTNTRVKECSTRICPLWQYREK